MGLFGKKEQPNPYRELAIVQPQKQKESIIDELNRITNLAKKEYDLIQNKAANEKFKETYEAVISNARRNASFGLNHCTFTFEKTNYATYLSDIIKDKLIEDKFEQVYQGNKSGAYIYFEW